MENISGSGKQAMIPQRLEWLCLGAFATSMMITTPVVQTSDCSMYGS